MFYLDYFTGLSRPLKRMVGGGEGNKEGNSNKENYIAKNHIEQNMVTLCVSLQQGKY